METVQANTFSPINAKHTESIKDIQFRERLLKVPRIFFDWLDPLIDFSKTDIIDFGCGDGTIALGIAKQVHPRSITGIDIQYIYNRLQPAMQMQLGYSDLPANLHFKTILPGQKIAETIQAHCILSWSVFEHIDRKIMDGILHDLWEALVPGGYFFLQISPLFFSPSGAHLNDIVSEPWVHLLEQENHLYQRIMSAKRRLDDAADLDRTEDYDFISFKHLLWHHCYQTLNKITADELVERVLAQGFSIERQHRTETQQKPVPALLHIFKPEVLKTEQIVLLLRK